MKGFQVNLSRRSYAYVSAHDNCADRDDPAMRIRWMLHFGPIRPIWILKPYRETLEFGFEIAGVWFTIMIDTPLIGQYFLKSSEPL